jgi:hypothetical protein
MRHACCRAKLGGGGKARVNTGAIRSADAARAVTRGTRYEPTSDGQ